MEIVLDVAARKQMIDVSCDARVEYLEAGGGGGYRATL